MMKITKGRAAFNAVNYTVLAIVALLCIYPIWYVLVASFSSPQAISMGKVWFFPNGFNVNAYIKVFHRSGIWISYLNSVYYMFFGTLVNLIITVCGAYPLSKKRLFGSKFLNICITFTMWFSAGTIPIYLTFRDYGLLNTRSAIIFGFACSAYNFILLRTYFAGLPEALEEAAKIDGASDIYILWHIILPLAVPSLATVGLFYAVSRWNGYLWAMILINQDDSKLPLQVVLKKLVVDMSGHSESVSLGTEAKTSGLSEETVMYATMVFSILPMLAIYPFIQRFFVKGITIGSVKG